MGWNMASISLAASLALAGPAAAAETVVEMTADLRFVPQTVTIQAGETVEWRNASPMAHTVTADPAKAGDPAHVALPEGAQPFDSGFVQPGGSYRHRFEVPGTYRYFCIPHEAAGMVGTVEVR